VPQGLRAATRRLPQQPPGPAASGQ